MRCEFVHCGTGLGVDPHQGRSRTVMDLLMSFSIEKLWMLEKLVGRPIKQVVKAELTVFPPVTQKLVEFRAVRANSTHQLTLEG